MRVIGVADDHAAGIAGYVRQTLECSACRDIETRTTRRRPDAAALQTGAAPDTSASSQPTALPPAAVTPPPSIAPPSTPPEPAPPPPAPAESSVAPPPGDPFEQAELLLQRAIEMVRGPLRPAQSPPKGLTDGLPEQPPPKPLLELPDEIDEGEALLKRAIEMVRGPARDPSGSTKAVGLAGIAPPAVPAKTTPVKKSPTRTVRICHDPAFDAVYAAKDATSGLVVIRHQDSARLRAMCERLGWQVIDNAASPPEAL